MDENIPILYADVVGETRILLKTGSSKEIIKIYKPLKTKTTKRVYVQLSRRKMNHRVREIL